MPEEMAFQILVAMMQKYGLRELYKAGFENLTLRFYQVRSFSTSLQALLIIFFPSCSWRD